MLTMDPAGAEISLVVGSFCDNFASGEVFPQNFPFNLWSPSGFES